LTVKILDTENIENNTFWVVNQFVVKENNQEKRCDVVVFINGLPLVLVELKSALDEQATLEKAYTQIQNYRTAIPNIFFYNALCVISDGMDARVSSLSAPFSRYLAWKSPEKKENETFPEMQIMTERMFEKKTLINLIRYNTVFESEEKMDTKTGIKSIVKIKKVAAYHQYYAVQKAVQKTLEATDESEGDRKI
jgi:type I restriction enzyme R subunit